MGEISESLQDTSVVEKDRTDRMKSIPLLLDRFLGIYILAFVNTRNVSTVFNSIKY